MYVRMKSASDMGSTGMSTPESFFPGVKLTMTTQLRTRLSALAADYGATVSFEDLGPDDAGNTRENRIVLCSTLKGHDLVSAFYHELGHAHFYNTGVHRDYHEPDLFERTPKYCDWKKSLAVEKQVDDWAEQEARKHGVREPVYKFYHRESAATVIKLLKTVEPACCSRKK